MTQMFDLCYKQRGETFYLKVTKVHLGNLNKKLLKKFRLFLKCYAVTISILLI